MGDGVGSVGRDLPRGPILFAHRGASALAPENTLEAFRLAIELGATGLESDVHLASDGTPVLVHDPIVRTSEGPIVVAETSAKSLRRIGIPSLADLYASCGASLPFSLDINDRRAVATADAVVACAHDFGAGAAALLLLCHGEVDVLTTIASRTPEVTLVHSAERSVVARLEEHARRLSGEGVRVLNLHRRDWIVHGTADEAVATVHEAGLRAFAWDTQSARSARVMLTAGVDAVYADDPRVLVTAWAGVDAKRRAGSA